MRSLNDDWIEVYQGAPAVALAVSERLQGEGLRTFVPDQNLRVIDAFKTGGSAFELRVLVAREDHEQALALLELDRSAADDELRIPEEDVLEQRVVDARRLGERVIAAAVLGWTAPLALWMARRYFALVKKLDAPPRRHRFVQAATVLAALEIVGLVVVGFVYFK